MTTWFLNFEGCRTARRFQTEGLPRVGERLAVKLDENSDVVSLFVVVYVERDLALTDGRVNVWADRDGDEAPDFDPVRFIEFFDIASKKGVRRIVSTVLPSEGMLVEGAQRADGSVLLYRATGDVLLVNDGSHAAFFRALVELADNGESEAFFPEDDDEAARAQPDEAPSADEVTCATCLACAELEASGEDPLVVCGGVRRAPGCTGEELPDYARLVERFKEVEASRNELRSAIWRAKEALVASGPVKGGRRAAWEILHDALVPPDLLAEERASEHDPLSARLEDVLTDNKRLLERLGELQPERDALATALCAAKSALEDGAKRPATQGDKAWGIAHEALKGAPPTDPKRHPLFRAGVEAAAKIVGDETTFLEGLSEKNPEAWAGVLLHQRHVASRIRALSKEVRDA